MQLISSFYICNFSVSIPVAFAVFNSFGTISGYKLKSELFPLNKAVLEYPLHSLPFRIAKHSFTYLGIQVTLKFKNHYKDNFVPFLSRMQEDFDRWSVLNLSLTAWLNSVKIIILLKFLPVYLFQCRPNFPTQVFFFLKLIPLFSNLFGTRNLEGSPNNFYRGPKHWEEWFYKIQDLLLSRQS